MNRTNLNDVLMGKRHIKTYRSHALLIWSRWLSLSSGTPERNDRKTPLEVIGTTRKIER